jgi:hypothetical protein
MHSWSEWVQSLITYTVAIMAILFNTALENSSHIVAFLGFVLLIARLIQEVPKAYRQIKAWITGEQLE